MTTPQHMAADAMFSALKNLPCGCLHNVPYAGGQVEQFVKTQCARCRSMAAWTLATGEKPVAAAEQAS